MKRVLTARLKAAYQPHFSYDHRMLNDELQLIQEDGLKIMSTNVDPNYKIVGPPPFQL
jgi:hypothetical protein